MKIKLAFLHSSRSVIESGFMARLSWKKRVPGGDMGFVDGKLNKVSLKLGSSEGEQKVQTFLKPPWLFWWNNVPLRLLIWFSLIEFPSIRRWLSDSWGRFTVCDAFAVINDYWNVQKLVYVTVVAKCFQRSMKCSSWWVEFEWSVTFLKLTVSSFSNL